MPQESAQEPSIEPGVSQEEQPQGTAYILNTNTHKFHYPTCRSVKQMKEENKQNYTGSRDDVISMINHRGTFVDGLKISDVTLDRFSLDYKSTIRFRMEVREDAVHVGGLTLFGNGFGNLGTSLSTKEMSEGQSLFTPGASLESSMEKVISSIFWAVGSTFGIRYST